MSLETQINANSLISRNCGFQSQKNFEIAISAELSTAKELTEQVIGRINIQRLEKTHRNNLLKNINIINYKIEEENGSFFNLFKDKIGLINISPILNCNRDSCERLTM